MHFSVGAQPFCFRLFRGSVFSMDFYLPLHSGGGIFYAFLRSLDPGTASSMHFLLHTWGVASPILFFPCTEPWGCSFYAFSACSEPLGSSVCASLAVATPLFFMFFFGMPFSMIFYVHLHTWGGLFYAFLCLRCRWMPFCFSAFCT